MVYFTCRDYFDLRRSNKELNELSAKMRNLKYTESELFCFYWASKNGVYKMHTLDHACEEIREVANLVYFYARFY